MSPNATPFTTDSAHAADGPLTNDTVAYGYDALGRVVFGGVQSVGTTTVYDGLGRVSSETSPLGTFAYGYDGVSDRVTSVLYPNGQTSTLTYFNALGDYRLQTIHHKHFGGATLSRFDYTYDAAGNIRVKQEQSGSAPPVRWQYTLDAVDQLVQATKTTTAPTPVVLERYAYTYDLAGNRTAEQINNDVVSFAYDALNRLTGQSAGGPLRVAGLVSEPAIVTIAAGVQIPSADDRFEGGDQSSGRRAGLYRHGRDPSGNVQTQTYQVTGAATGGAWDLNGAAEQLRVTSGSLRR